MGNICDSRECGGTGPSRHILHLYDVWRELPHNRAARASQSERFAAGGADLPQSPPGGMAVPPGTVTPALEREQVLSSLDALYRMQFEDQDSKISGAKAGRPNIHAMTAVHRVGHFHHHFELNITHPVLGKHDHTRWCITKDQIGRWHFLAPPPAECTGGADSLNGLGMGTSFNSSPIVISAPPPPPAAAGGAAGVSGGVSSPAPPAVATPAAGPVSPPAAENGSAAKKDNGNGNGNGAGEHAK